MHARLRRRGGEARARTGTKVGSGFVPHISQNNKLLYAYFAIGLLGAAMTPYEVYFYSSGGVEDRWSPKDIGLNRANAIVGYALGGTLSFALMIVGGALFLGHGISPEHLGTIALGAEQPLGQIGLLLALVGHPLRGRRRLDRHRLLGRVQPRAVLRLGVGALPASRAARRASRSPGSCCSCSRWAIVMTGVDPVVLTEYAVIFSVVALPLTYIPILLVANDTRVHGPLPQRPARERARARLSRRDRGRRADARSR